MPVVYMAMWSVILIIVLGLSRLRNWAQVFVVSLVTALVLIFSQSLFIQFALISGVDPGAALSNPVDFLRSGPGGWFALLVMPCGWLGPVIGLSLVKRWRDTPSDN